MTQDASTSLQPPSPEALIAQWWFGLEDRLVPGDPKPRRGRPGERAELARCGQASEVYMCVGYQRLRQKLAREGGHDALEREVRLAWLERDDRLAVIAAVLSHVREDEAADPERASWYGDMAVALASSAQGSDRAVMSGLRFRRLLQADAPDDLLLSMVRAVRMARGKAAVRTLAKDLLSWARGDEDRVRRAWTSRYYERALSED